MEISGCFTEIRVCTYMYTHTYPYGLCAFYSQYFPAKGILRTQEEKVPPRVRFRVFSCGLLKGKMTSHYQLRHAGKIEK